MGDIFRFETGISQSSSSILRLPWRTSLLSFIATNFFLSRRIVQLSSAIRPRDIREELLSSGMTAAFFAEGDKKGDNGICPVSVDEMKDPSGRTTLGPQTDFISVKIFLSSSRQ